MPFLGKYEPSKGNRTNRQPICWEPQQQTDQLCFLNNNACSRGESWHRNKPLEGENFQPITKRRWQVTSIAAAPTTELKMMTPGRPNHHLLQVDWNTTNQPPPLRVSGDTGWTKPLQQEKLMKSQKQLPPPKPDGDLDDAGAERKRR
jgi:hypothetical protein